MVIGLDAGLQEAYSFGRRNPRIPFFAGFEREDKEKILRAFPTAAYRVCELACSREQKEEIRERLRQDYKKRLRYHYAVPGLPFIALGRPFYLKNQYTCSSYIARLLEEHQIRISEKHFSLVTPKDFYLYPYQRVVFEGSLAGFMGAGAVAAAGAEAASGTWKDKGRERRMPKPYGTGASERVVAYGS